MQRLVTLGNPHRLGFATESPVPLYPVVRPHPLARDSGSWQRYRGFRCSHLADPSQSTGCSEPAKIHRQTLVYKRHRGWRHGASRYLHSAFPRMPKLPPSETAGSPRGCAAPPKNNHSGRRLWCVPGLPHRASGSDRSRRGEAQKFSRPRRPQRRSARRMRRRIRSLCPRWKPTLSRTDPQEYPG